MHRRIGLGNCPVGAFVAAFTMMAPSARAEDVAACIRASDEGQQLRDDGDWVHARERFSACAAETCPAIIRRDCGHWLSDIDDGFPSVVFVVRWEDGKDVTDVRVFVDGQPTAVRFDGRSTAINPGAHVLRFEPLGAASIEQRIVVHAGEKNRVIRVTVPGPPRSKTPKEPELTKPSAKGSVSASPWPYVVGGVGVVALGGFAYFGIRGWTERSDLASSTCAPTKTCSPDDVAVIRKNFLIADVSFGIGAVAVGTATWLFFRDRASRSGSVAAVSVAPLTGGALFSIGGTFADPSAP